MSFFYPYLLFSSLMKNIGLQRIKTLKMSPRHIAKKLGIFKRRQVKQWFTFNNSSQSPK